MTGHASLAPSRQLFYRYSGFAASWDAAFPPRCHVGFANARHLGFPFISKRHILTNSRLPSLTIATPSFSQPTDTLTFSNLGLYLLPHSIPSLTTSGIMVPVGRLTKKSLAVRMLHSKFEKGEITGGESPKAVWASDAVFQKHKLGNFRTCYNAMRI